jgi:phosphoribosyl 1,2-cyclic phosphate phosphodiesterase
VSLRVTMLGSGTSTGVPVIGCRCSVCTSEDPRNRRLRCSLRIEVLRPGEDRILLVDSPPDLRQQALTHRIDRVDAVLYTHAHADHIYGLDDLRAFNFRQDRPIPCYGSGQTLTRLRQSFAYVFDGSPEEGGGKPQLDLVEVREPFLLAGRRIQPVPVGHGNMEVFGYRLGRFAYVTDCNRIPEASRSALQGLEVLILGALRYRPHPTHYHLEEAVKVAQELGAERTIFTHLSHEVDHGSLKITLPPGIELGYDGLRFEIAD